jgi:ATP-binding cassette subfamily A (ABC1) protein 3
LWDNLTVREHLLFFVRLKGVGFLDENAHVDQCLRDYGLFSVKTRLSSALSGGMKRRLCVAIALAGMSRVVFLDEPTTGLDPVSKRQLWSIISASKAGRSVVLTTHDLFEAEILSQRIAIMGLGELKALGSPLHLKTKFATGFRLVIDFKGVAQEVDGRLRELLKHGCTLELLNSFTNRFDRLPAFFFFFLIFFC